MQKDLEEFENRSDDWLAKQRAYEDRVSAWDFDEGKKLKIEHEIKHQEYNRINNIRPMKMEAPAESRYQNRIRQQQKKKTSQTVGFVFVILWFLMMMVSILLD